MINLLEPVTIARLFTDGNTPFFIAAGFFAQLIDGTLGMAYGVSCTTFLLSLGISPVAASAGVHASELFTTAVSGFFHFKLGNVNKELLKKLAIPGILGGVLGAYLLTVIPSETIKPFVSVYLLVMGLVILFKALSKHTQRKPMPNLIQLGFLGGFVDSIGGGGWGPLVTSSLVAHVKHPRFAIGSVNAAEFFVTAATSATFFATLGLIHLQIILGLILGGVLAAPIAAWTCKHLAPRPLMIAIGIVIIALSIRTLYQLPVQKALLSTVRITANSGTFWK